jgi:hypothetical protein
LARNHTNTTNRTGNFHFSVRFHYSSFLLRQKLAENSGKINVIEAKVRVVRGSKKFYAFFLTEPVPKPRFFHLFAFFFVSK